MKYILVLLSFFFSNYAFANSYLCKGEKMVGFDGSSNFEIKTFEPKSFVLRSASSKEHQTSEEGFELVDLANDTSILGCSGPGSKTKHEKETGEEETLFKCGSISAGFVLNPKTKKFLFHSYGTYIHNGTADTVIAHGSCIQV